MKYHEVFCIRCHGQINPAHPCPWCKDKNEKEVSEILLRRQNQALNIWMRKFLTK
jgi:hypothetical protein